MKKRELSDDIIEATESTLAETVELLDKFNVGEYWEKSFYMLNNPQDTTTMMKYVKMLRQEGLDVGRGESQFGYKMPLPEKGTNTRYLQIFRRK
jgi:hypothetical protein